MKKGFLPLQTIIRVVIGGLLALVLIGIIVLLKISFFPSNPNCLDSQSISLLDNIAITSNNMNENQKGNGVLKLKDENCIIFGVTYSGTSDMRVVRPEKGLGSYGLHNENSFLCLCEYDKKQKKENLVYVCTKNIFCSIVKNINLIQIDVKGNKIIEKSKEDLLSVSLIKDSSGKLTIFDYVEESEESIPTSPEESESSQPESTPVTEENFNPSVSEQPKENLPIQDMPPKVTTIPTSTTTSNSPTIPPGLFLYSSTASENYDYENVNQRPEDYPENPNEFQDSNEPENRVNTDVDLSNVPKECVPALVNGEPKVKEDILFLMQSNDNGVINSFPKIIDMAIDQDGNNYGFGNTEPYKSNLDRMNFWYIKESQDLGCDESLQCDEDKINEDKIKCPSDKVIILSDFGNLIGMSYYGSSIGEYAIIDIDSESLANPMIAKLAVHEQSHTYGLHDEYYDGSGSEGYPNCVESIKEAKAEKIWFDAVGKGSDPFVVGYYQKGCGSSPDNYVPTKTSIMDEKYVFNSYSPEEWTMALGLVNINYIKQKLEKYESTREKAST